MAFAEKLKKQEADEINKIENNAFDGAGHVGSY